MSDIKYSITIPYNPDPSDRLTKVQVYGNLKEDAQQFSINFVNDTSNIDNITYHFKVKIPEKELIENYKYKGMWAVEKKTCNTAFDENFRLEFYLDNKAENFRVYQINLDGFNFVTSYDPLDRLSLIQSIQVWGDVEKITQLLLTYE